MASKRAIKQVLKRKPTLEGAGVHLHRIFGFNESPELDPFLLLDDFGSDDPDDYVKGFPWHPHRGIETITYVTRGEVEHGDSLGNKGVIGPGDVQWMTAGSGIIHQEMPRGDRGGAMYGFQLWANLPASQKMTQPRYRGITRDQIPEVELSGGAKVRVIAGAVGGVKGPVDDVAIQPEYLDCDVPPGEELVHETEVDHTAFIYIVDGKGSVGETTVRRGELVLFHQGESLAITAADRGLRCILVTGRPLGEPVAWRGPIVMNTQKELAQAFREYQEGTFIKSR